MRDQHMIEKYKLQTNLFWSNFYQSWATPTTSGQNNESSHSPAAVFNHMHLHIWCHLQDPSIDGCGYTVQIVSLWSSQAVFFLDLECCWMCICIFTYDHAIVKPKIPFHGLHNKSKTWLFPVSSLPILLIPPSQLIHAGCIKCHRSPHLCHCLLEVIQSQSPNQWCRKTPI